MIWIFSYFNDFVQNSWCFNIMGINIFDLLVHPTLPKVLRAWFLVLYIINQTVWSVYNGLMFRTEEVTSRTINCHFDEVSSSYTWLGCLQIYSQGKAFRSFLLKNKKRSIQEGISKGFIVFLSYDRLLPGIHSAQDKDYNKIELSPCTNIAMQISRFYRF